MAWYSGEGTSRQRSFVMVARERSSAYSDMQFSRSSVVSDHLTLVFWVGGGGIHSSSDRAAICRLGRLFCSCRSESVNIASLIRRDKYGALGVT
jgi:imidazole glycerol phosphate synthase subunit HisF